MGQLDVAVNAACCQRLHRIDHGHERFELDLDSPGGTLGGLAVLGGDDDDGLADIAHVVVGQDRLVVVDGAEAIVGHIPAPSTAWTPAIALAGARSMRRIRA